ncbi:hypothetical protein L6164_024061 [Bauhinia variegata]|uniref:Uncharacterized protein n=1 Tax=Bauhinia variegata TaxID=167791 RepID=A0ACB9LXB8_BAUVA|nr:hypothetical protein L6164_024061 [Bauhinia variegata]
MGLLFSLLLSWDGKKYLIMGQGSKTRGNYKIPQLKTETVPRREGEVSILIQIRSIPQTLKAGKRKDLDLICRQLLYSYVGFSYATNLPSPKGEGTKSHHLLKRKHQPISRTLLIEWQTRKESYI